MSSYCALLVWNAGVMCGQGVSGLFLSVGEGRGWSVVGCLWAQDQRSYFGVGGSRVDGHDEMRVGGCEFDVAVGVDELGE
jgi:hypothetical protein